MRRVCFAFMMLLGSLMMPKADAQTQHLALRLVAESDAPRSGSDVTIAIDSRPEAGWHGYWENPGDAGFPAKLDWTLPKGAGVTAPEYPVPQTLLIAGLMNYVFEKPYAPLVTLHVPAGLAAGTMLPLRVRMNYLVCTAELCVPEAADLALDLVVGDGAVDPARRAQFDTWRRAIPRSLDAAATVAVTNGAARVAVPYPASAPLTDAYFFPLSGGVIDYAAPQTVTRDGDRLVIATKASGKAAALEGVLRIGPDRGLRVKVNPGTVAESANGAGGWLAGAAIAFAGALLGGLILNVMPCVFPILSLKALALARGHLDERAARREALAYAAGVVAVCLALGGLILGLRAGGSAVGWAFQLQDPRVVVLLLLLTVGIALNLSGVFEFATPRFAGRDGAGGAFMTGALAAFVATPCTGPFMGAALGAALVLPWPAALAVFAGLGIGLALPFLLLGFVPALRRMLPKPGAWMETFRHILSVPMWLTALALAWVLGRQAGVNGMTLGLGAALVAAMLLWRGGRRQGRGQGFGVAGIFGLICISSLSVALLARQPASAAASQSAFAEPFSEARLAALRAEGRPVFAYFTADWCLTCKVNEKVAIDTDATRAAFAKKKVAVLVADWTDGDPVLGRFIEAHNRAGVPLYLYYAPGAAEPRVLPQVLTAGMLAEL